MKLYGVVDIVGLSITMLDCFEKFLYWLDEKRPADAFFWIEVCKEMLLSLLKFLSFRVASNVPKVHLSRITDLNCFSALINRDYPCDFRFS